MVITATVPFSELVMERVSTYCPEGKPAGAEKKSA
jgi:hypothetical protein